MNRTLGFLASGLALVVGTAAGPARGVALVGAVAGIPVTTILRQ